MKQHPIRPQLISEVHARPFQQLTAPLGLLHIAAAYEPERDLMAGLVELLDKVGASSTELSGGFFFIKGEQISLRYEPHSEFYTVTLYRHGVASTAELTQLWKELPGELICGVDLTFFKVDDRGLDFSFQAAERQVAGSDVMAGAARIRTDFYPQGEDGFVRIEVADRHLQGYQAGRLLQRLCEIETYRHTALLALPVAQQAVPLISEMDCELAEVTHRITEGANSHQILRDLTSLAARVEELSADTANRFSATEAYFAVVDARISELRESRNEGLQTVEQFMERRLDPAKRTCQSVSRRIERLSQRIARASELIRSQVDLSIEQQNQQLLTGLNDRARRQLRLQAKLESFTIIVVTYYAFDLIERTIRNTVAEEGIQSDVLMVLSFCVPLIAGVLWWYVRRLLKAYGEDE